MGIEDDMFNAFKYAGFGKRSDPTVMIHTLLRNLEVSMLSQMSTRIQARLRELSSEETPQDDSMDPFEILGVNMDSTREEVDRAYKVKAKEAHPDVGGSNIEMAKVNAAYEAIRMFKNWKEK